MLVSLSEFGQSDDANYVDGNVVLKAINSLKSLRDVLDSGGVVSELDTETCNELQYLDFDHLAIGIMRDESGKLLMSLS